MVKYKVLERDGTWYEREIGDGGTSFDYNALNRHISIATDSADQPHIIYSASTNSVTYAYKEGSGWNTEIIDDLSISSYSQGDCSIAIDTNGYPHVIYADVANGALKYAVKNSHGWQKEIVDSGPDFLSIGVINSLALDSANSPHILYNNNGMLHSFLIPQLPDIPRIEPSTTHIVAADGGTALAGSGGLYTKHGIVIPAGSLAQDTEIEIKQPDDDHGLYSAVEIGPTNTVFSKPATITIEYKDSDVPSGHNENAIRLLVWEGGQWKEVPGCTVNTEENIVSGNVDHLSTYGAGIAGSVPVPEYPSITLPVMMIIGFLGTVLLIQRMREQ